MVAVPLIFGRLTAKDYEDEIAADPRIDALREKIVCVEDPNFTDDYFDPEKRSIANALTIEFNDGTMSDEIVVEYPVGHRRRREEGLPLLIAKYQKNLRRVFSEEVAKNIEKVSLDIDHLLTMKADDFVSLFVKN
jgi:2-methylcitrate dehydratase